jgi:hypothetical protein
MTTLTSGLPSSNMVSPNQEMCFLEVQFCEDSLQVWFEGSAGLEIFKALNASTEKSSKGKGAGTKAEYLQGWHVYIRRGNAFVEEIQYEGHNMIRCPLHKRMEEVQSSKESREEKVIQSNQNNGLRQPSIAVSTQGWQLRLTAVAVECGLQSWSDHSNLQARLLMKPISFPQQCKSSEHNKRP